MFVPQSNTNIADKNNKQEIFSEIRKNLIMNKLYLLILCVITVVSLADQFAVSLNIQFEKKALNLEKQMDGAILRDRDGFLWFGAYGGASRYDGHKLKKFALGSGGGTWVTTIAEDKDALLWFGTRDGGVSSYNKKTNTWINYKHDPKNKNSISSNVLPGSPQTLYIDQYDKLWVGTEGAGLNLFDKNTNTWIHYKHDPDNNNSLINDKVKAISEDKYGLLWIGTMEGGLSCYDRKNKKWSHYQHDPDDDSSLSDNHVQSIIEDKDGILWIGTAKGGLNRFNRSRQTFSHFKHDPDNDNSLGDNNVFFIMEDSLNRLWLCKHHGNPEHAPITIFDKNKSQFYRLYFDPNKSSSPSSSFVSRVYEDPVTGIFWFSNWISGIIDKFDKNRPKFKRWDHEPNYPDYLREQSITELYEDSRGIIWIGSESAGITSYNKQTGKFTQYAPDPNRKETSLPYAWVSAILEEKDGKFWLACKDMLCIFDRKTGQVVKRYQHDPNNPNSIRKTFGFRSLIQDKDDPDIFWLGTQDNGIQRFDRKREFFVAYKHEQDDLSSLSFDANRILYDDGKGSLWVPSFNGLNRLNKKTGDFKHYFHDPDNPKTIFSNFLLEVYGDRKGNLWICGKSGIAKFDYDSESFTNYTKANGYPVGDANTFSLFEGKNGNLWLGSVGIIQFNPKTETFKLYTKSDNLQPNFFLPNANLQTKDGEIWLGGLNGLNSFYPDQLVDNGYIPPLVLTSLKQGGKDINMNMASEKVNEIVLDWQDNFFEFQFAALNYTRPGNNKYAYMLEGRDKKWYYCVDNNPSGMYSGLESGSYTLRLKGSNNDGVWNEKGISIRVTVNSPPYKTWWFYTLNAIFLFLVGLAVFIQRGRHQKAKSEARLLNQEMDIAKRIQTSLLPKNPQHDEVAISAFMRPADKVGGDFYDISYDKAGNLWLGIGDVSGHGVTPGLIMMMTQTVFTAFQKTISQERITPKEVIITINEVLVENVQNRLDENHFMTLTILKYLGSGQFSYAGAHLDLIIHRANSDSFDTVRTFGLFMNIIPDVSEITKDAVFTLESGDTLILYTDGIPEARNMQEAITENQYLNFKRFLAIIKKHIHKKVEEVKEGIIRDTISWCRNKVTDDLTLIVIRKN